MTGSSLCLKAPGKINWFLRVVGLRNDDFHEIQSLIQKITLYDVLTFIPSKDLILNTDSSIPIKENLVYRAAMLLKDTYKVKEGAIINMKKHIPIGGGLGGGSSDAAATLQGLNKLWSLGLSIEALCKLAEKIGSDVPFFLHGAVSFVEGRGERVTEYKMLRSLNILLVKPEFSISTKWAYKNFSTSHLSVNKFDKRDFELKKNDNRVNNIEHLIRAIEEAEFERIADHIFNDLESVIIKHFPVIATIKERLRREGAVVSLMSGSGPTVFGVFTSKDKAEKASRTFKNYWTAVVQTMTD